jgi:hypothetical protein
MPLALAATDTQDARREPVAQAGSTAPGRTVIKSVAVADAAALRQMVIRSTALAGTPRLAHATTGLVTRPRLATRTLLASTP